jgi:hypothetical protein
MATVIEIVNAISQAVANTKHGARDENGELVEIGLRREVDLPITQRGFMDGFGVQFSGDLLRIKYHSEIHLKEVHHKDFEDSISQNIADIASFIQKEYKGLMGEELRLTKDGASDVEVQSISRLRSWVQASCSYKIGNLKGEGSMKARPYETRDAVKRFLDLGKKDQ